MKAKWKIFFALNILLAFFALIFLIATIATFNTLNDQPRNFIFSVIFTFSFAVMTINGLLNIFLLLKFYPDKPVPAATKNISLLFLIITSIIIAVVILGCLVAIFFSDDKTENISSKIALVITFFAGLLQIAVLIMQGQLPPVIRRNHQNNMHSLIDSIGQTA